jgi:hypothetical protein
LVRLGLHVLEARGLVTLVEMLDERLRTAEARLAELEPAGGGAGAVESALPARRKASRKAKATGGTA